MNGTLVSSITLKCQSYTIPIIIIKIHYVETDAMSFKSIVQKLTGKDSTVVAAKASQSKSSGNAVLTRDISFKEFNRLL
ncbi:hypothetical protein ACB092_11G070000 [Castanea dentata]